ncbi:MAG: PAS domain S-box protein [Burkholderiales bacterium]
MLHAGDGSIVAANPALADLLGISREALTGTPFARFIAASERDRWEAHFALAAKAGGEATGRFPFAGTAAGGCVADVHLRRASEPGSPVVLSVRPVAAGDRPATGAGAGDARFRAIFDQAAVGIAQVSLEGKWLEVNATLCEIIGYPADVLASKTFQDITHPDDLDLDLGYVQQILAGERDSYTMEKRYFHRDGHVVWVLLTGSVVRDAARQPQYFVAIVEDITGRKRAEEALRVNEERLRLALLATNQGLFDVDLRTGEVVLSPEYMRMLGYDTAEAHVTFDRIREWRHPDSLARTNQVFLEYREGRRDSHREEIRQRSATGAWIWTLSMGRVVERDAHGRALRVIGTNSDISESKRLEESLRREESQLRLLVTAAPHGALVVGPGGVIELVNDRLAQMFGYEPAELTGAPIERLLPESLQARHVGLRNAFLADPAPRVLGGGRELAGRRRDGSTFPIEIGLAPVESGSRRVVLATVIDITSRLAAAAVLRESERRLRDFAEGLPQLAWTSTPEGDCDFLNRRWDEYTGVPREEQIGSHWMHCIHPDDRPRLSAIWGESVATGKDFAISLRIRRADGAYRWFDARARAIRDDDGRIVKWVGSNTDIHELLEVQERLAESEERLRLALFATRQGLFDLDMRTDRIVVTPEYSRILGFESPGDLADLAAIRALRHPEEDDRAERLYEEYRAGRRSRHDIEMRMLTRSGETIWVRSVAQVIERDEQGRPLRLIGTQTDITDRKRAEEDRARERTLLRTLIDTIPDNVFTKDLQGRFVICNIATLRHLGFTDEAAVRGRTVRELFPAAMADVYDSDDARTLAGETVVNDAEVSRDAEGGIGTYFTIKAPLRDEQGRIVGLVGLSRNVTERTRAAEALRKSEEQLRATVLELRRQTELLARRNLELTQTQAALAEAAKFNEEILGSVNVGIVVYDRNLICVSRNAYMEKLTGLRNESMIGRHLLEISAGLQAYDILSILKRVLAGETIAIERYVGRVRGGADILPPDSGDTDDPDTQWGYLVFQPNRNASGEIVGFITSVQDATARHRAEAQIRRLNVELEDRIRERTLQLQAANRELETFAYSVSHDLKAPLRGIDGYSRLLEEDFGDRLDDDGRLFLGNIRSGILQMSVLIDDLLAYSRMERQKLQDRSLDLGTVVRAVVGEFRREIEEGGVRLSVDVPDLAVRGDPQGVRIVLRNVLQNALRFSHKASPPTIHVAATDGDKSVRLHVRDNGIGFDMRFHDRIFEIFQRLQRAEDYPGTGVGLALVRKAMQRMGGRVWAESAPGEGATFHLEFPK